MRGTEQKRPARDESDWWVCGTMKRGFVASNGQGQNRKEVGGEEAKIIKIEKSKAPLQTRGRKGEGEENNKKRRK